MSAGCMQAMRKKRLQIMGPCLTEYHQNKASCDVCKRLHHLYHRRHCQPELLDKAAFVLFTALLVCRCSKVNLENALSMCVPHFAHLWCSKCWLHLLMVRHAHECACILCRS